MLVSAAQWFSSSASHPYCYTDRKYSNAKQLPASILPCLRHFLSPLDTVHLFSALKIPFYMFQESFSILCPDGNLQLRGTRSWRVFSWPASQQAVGTVRGRLNITQTRLCCTAKALSQFLSKTFLNTLFVFHQCFKPFNSLCFPGPHFV